MLHQRGFFSGDRLGLDKGLEFCILWHMQRGLSILNKNLLQQCFLLFNWLCAKREYYLCFKCVTYIAHFPESMVEHDVNFKWNCSSYGLIR